MVNNELVEELRRTREMIDELYPVLKDKKGRTVDCRHRERAGWKSKQTLSQLDTDAKSILARILVHKIRREVTKNEQKDAINALASILLKKGIKPGKIGPLIHEMTGYTLAAIDSWLDPKYKLGLKTIFEQKIPIFE